MPNALTSEQHKECAGPTTTGFGAIFFCEPVTRVKGRSCLSSVEMKVTEEVAVFERWGQMALSGMQSWEHLIAPRQ